MADLSTISIKGKAYVTVNSRLKYFRENFQGYALLTELVEVNDKSALIRAVVKNDKGEIVATGCAFERADNKGSMVNATSHVENCETSAWGRALGNFGIGIDVSVASADEVERAPAKPAFTDKATGDQLDEISAMCEQTETDKAKLFEHFYVKGEPTKEQAQRMLASLKLKLDKQLNALA